MGAKPLTDRTRARSGPGAKSEGVAGNAWSAIEPGTGRSGRASATVVAVAAEWVETISAVVEAGWGLVISGTSDGGAVRIAVLIDGDTIKKYASGAEELEILLRDLYAYASAGVAGRANGTGKT